MQENDGTNEEQDYVLPESGPARNTRELLELQGTAWAGLVRAIAEMQRGGIQITAIKLIGGFRGDEDTLIVVQADTEDGPLVAFYGAESIGTLWQRLLRKIERDGLAWKDDEYAGRKR